MDAHPALSLPFPAARQADWEPLARAALKGRPSSTLVHRLLDGMDVQPLYTAESPAAGASSVGARVGAWDIRAEHSADDPAAIADDVAREASSIWLRDPARTGWTAARLAPLLAVIPEGVGVIVECPSQGGPALAALRSLKRPLIGGLQVDPLGELAVRGGLDGTLDGAWDDIARLHVNDLPEGFFVTSISTLPVAEAGGSVVSELAWMLGCAAALLRALDARGNSPADARVGLTIGVGRDQLTGLARLRAARRLWTHLLAACGVSAARVPVHARQLDRGLSTRDPWTNLLRGTMAGFVGAVGGADAVTVRPFDAALGTPGALGRKLALNTQLLLAHESELDATVDPAHGAWALESLTDDLCRAAWARFQEWEGRGGVAAMLHSGELQGIIAHEAEERRHRIADRTDVLVGVSEFALPQALDLRTEPAAPLAVHPAPAVQRLVPRPDAAPWEALQAAGQDSGERVFVANWGPLRTHKARAEWVANLVHASGLTVVQGAPDQASDQICAAFVASGARAVVVCAADKHQLDAVVALHAKLTSAGARWCAVAGKPVDPGLPPLTHLFQGGPALAPMTALHAALEVGQ